MTEPLLTDAQLGILHDYADNELHCGADSDRAAARLTLRLLDEHAERGTENAVLRRGIAAAVPDYPHADPIGSGHPWPLVPVAAVLAVDAKLADVERERREAVAAAVEQERRAQRAESERDALRADLVAEQRQHAVSVTNCQESSRLALLDVHERLASVSDEHAERGKRIERALAVLDDTAWLPGDRVRTAARVLRGDT